VAVTGERLKIVAGRELPVMTTRFIVSMTTIPRNPLNAYGIVVTDVQFENEPDPHKGAFEDKKPGQGNAERSR